jgi:hypothetical protein
MKTSLSIKLLTFAWTTLEETSIVFVTGPKNEPTSNAMKSLNGGEKENKIFRISNYISFDNILMHIQLNQFDN